MVTRRILIALLLLAACKSTKSGGGEGSAAPKKLAIAVIPKGTTHEFWKSVHAGAEKAARELGVEISWKGPMKEDDLKQQIDLVQSFTAQGVDGIVLAPLNDKALRAAVKGAKTGGIPTVIFDSALAGDDMVSFVATDNLAAGKLAAERMAKLLGDKGRVAVLRYQEGSASTAAREQGFLDGIAKHSGIEVVSSNQYAGATAESAFAVAESLLGAQGAADGKLDGVFCPNESSTFGMLLALDKLIAAGKLGAGKVKFIGFDASDKLVKALESGHIDGLVLQNPLNMGYLAVKTLVTHKRGEKVEAQIDTGSRLVDKENMATPEIKELLSPNLEPWLGK
jgi:ribose transport system substrate-binding protein